MKHLDINLQREDVKKDNVTPSNTNLAFKYAPKDFDCAVFNLKHLHRLCKRDKGKKKKKEIRLAMGFSVVKFHFFSNGAYLFRYQLQIQCIK